MDSNTRAAAPESGNLINARGRDASGNASPVSLKSSEGSYLTLPDGRKLLDCDCNSGVFSLGHRNAAVISALDRALGSFDMGNHHLISETKGKLAKRLADLLPSGLVRTVFNVSRSEAVDSAIKLARGATGKGGVISAACAFHGSDGFALAASSPEFSTPLGFGVPGFFHIPYNDIASLKTMLDQNRGEIAAVILEPASAEAGVIVPDADYLKNALALCRKYGALLIVDESVTGLGRSGKLFSINRDNLTPDILIAGNALGGGVYPVHATCHTESLDRFFVKNPFIHISTFGGSDLGCFAAAAALEQLSSRELLKNVEKQSKSITGALDDLRENYPELISGIRSLGLLFGVEFAAPGTADNAQPLLLQRGVFCRAAALQPQTLLLLPPLNISDEEAGLLINALESTLSDLRRRQGGNS